jgi:hypothetical protein
VSEEFVAERLARYERDYKQGNRRALLFALADCTFLHYSPPLWVRDAYAEMLGAMRYSGSWDDVLGPLHPKGAKRTKLKTRHRALVPILRHVRERPKGVAIDRDLFEEIGKKADVRVGSATVERLYTEHRRELKAALAELGLNPQKTRK